MQLKFMPGNFHSSYEVLHANIKKKKKKGKWCILSIPYWRVFPVLIRVHIDMV